MAESLEFGKYPSPDPASIRFGNECLVGVAALGAATSMQDKMGLKNRVQVLAISLVDLSLTDSG